MKAVWGGKTIAESDQTIVVEGNHYFPLESVNRKYLKASDTTSICHWKGKANYYDLVVEGKTNKDAVWYYAQPSEAGSMVKNRVAFWNGVEVKE